VFRAYDPEREHLVAIKLFKLDLPPERVHQLVAAFERLIAAELSHPVLATPLATGIAGVTAYVVQDYVAAESLDLAVRERGPAPAADVLRVATDLAGALDSAAAVNIFHGALHPRDVLLSPDDTRLTGVGVARALEQVGITAPIRRPFTAPERVAGASWNRRADVFGLAALTHELLWGRRISGVGDKAVERLTPIDGGDPAAVRNAFARALAENPEERFATALDFAEALKHAFPGVDISSRRSAAGPQPVKRGSRMELEPRLPLDHASDSDPDLGLPSKQRALDIDERLTRPSARFGDVEAFPTEAEPAAAVDEPPAAAPIGFITGHDQTMSSALERSRSAVWPLALALIVGLAVGFAGGYGVGSHDRTAPTAVATTGAVQPAGREFTESAVTEPPKPAPAAAPTPAPVAPSPPELSTGRLLVRTTPAGASVSVDGRDYGKTPATVRDLARGGHRVRVTRDGYTPQERRVVISPSRPAQSVNIALVAVRVPPPTRAASAAPAAASATVDGRLAGVLAVDSRPSAAKVYLDGKLVGSTPLMLQTVAPGEHAVRLERDGYRPWSSSVRIVANERNRVTASLER